MVELITIKNTGHDTEGEPIWKCPMCTLPRVPIKPIPKSIIKLAHRVNKSFEEEKKYRLQVEADTASW
jgi:hypothetical protein